MDVFPLRLIFRLVEQGSCRATMAVSVPKRLFKRAVDRNLLKRRVREAYRLNKTAFYGRLESGGYFLEIVIQFRGKETAPFQTIEFSLKGALDQMMDRLERDPTG